MTKRTIFFIIIGVIIIIISGSWFIGRALKCKKDGLSFEEAIEISNQKLKVEFNGEFLLKKKEYSEDDKSWNFFYSDSSNGCAVEVIVDRCGVSDIGGITEKCFPIQKP